MDTHKPHNSPRSLLFLLVSKEEWVNRSKATGCRARNMGSSRQIPFTYFQNSF
jgi:hypothetical protein